MESDNGRVHSKTDASGSSSLCASKDYQAGDVVCKFKVKKNHPEASMYTLQIGSSTHVEVEPDELRVTFFYPSTEWDLGRPFTCSCGASNCLGRIEGARSTDRQLLQNYRLNNHILNQLDVSPEASQAKKHEASQAMSPEASQAKKSEPSQEASPWPRQSTEGRMFMYHSRTEKGQARAFSGPAPPAYPPPSPLRPPRPGLFVPGLTDGLMGCPYLNQLAASLWVDSKTRLVQPLLSSSGGCWWYGQEVCFKLPISSTNVWTRGSAKPQRPSHMAVTTHEALGSSSFPFAGGNSKEGGIL
eukprot:gene16717-22986_t